MTARERSLGAIGRRLASSFADWAGRRLERPAGGYWLPARARRRAVYCFLFGRTGQSLAAWLPDRDWLAAAGAAGMPLPDIIAITEDPRTARLAMAGGHGAVLVAPPAGLRATDQTQLLLGQLKNQFALHEPAGLLYTPELMSSLERPRRLTLELRELLGVDRAPLALSTPALLAGEIDLQVLDAYAKLQDWMPDLKGRIDIVHYGQVGYFDYAKLFAADSPARVRPLGWRFGPPGPAAAGRPGALVFDIDSPIVLRELLAMLADSPLHARYPLLLTLNPRTTSPLLEFIDGHGLLEWAAEGRAPVIADGVGSLLPLLAARCRVLLLRGASRTTNALLKTSYFLGAQRWPVLEKSRELPAALEQLEETWPEFEARRCAFELEEGADFTEGVIALLREL